MFHEYEITHNGQTMGNWSLMKAKQINLQEWESFGGGGYGESFYNKTDDSVILKLNKTSVSAEKAQEEFRCSKAVYDMGIPSYPAWKAACFWKETKKGSTYSTYKKAAIWRPFPARRAACFRKETKIRSHMLHIQKGRHRRPFCMWSIREHLAGNYRNIFLA